MGPQAIRDMFRDWHPREELIASGKGANFDLHREYRELGGIGVRYPAPPPLIRGSAML